VLGCGAAADQLDEHLLQRSPAAQVLDPFCQPPCPKEQNTISSGCQGQLDTAALDGSFDTLPTHPERNANVAGTDLSDRHSFSDNGLAPVESDDDEQGRRSASTRRDSGKRRINAAAA